VALRLKKLKEMRIIQNMYGMDLLKIGLSIAKVDVTTRNTTKVLNSLRNCPYFLNGFIVTGESNLCLFLIGEDVSTIEAIVDCHLRRVDDVQNVTFNIVIGVAKKLVMPLTTNVPRVDKAPCGVKISCIDCPVYGKRCHGCPVTGHYKGTLW
jgi:DNA-binding Lrp family transcriptional regulator